MAILNALHASYATAYGMRESAMDPIFTIKTGPFVFKNLGTSARVNCRGKRALRLIKASTSSAKVSPNA